MSKPEFVYVTYIETTAEKLWQALTDGDFTERYWFGYRVASDWKPGSPYRFARQGEGSVEGRIITADPPRRLAYPGTCARQAPNPSAPRASPSISSRVAIS